MRPSGYLCMQSTLLGLWLVPATISVYFHFWRFVSVWTLFTAMTGYILHTCASKHIDRKTPRKASLPPSACAPPRLKAPTPYNSPKLLEREALSLKLGSGTCCVPGELSGAEVRSSL